MGIQTALAKVKVFTMNFQFQGYAENLVELPDTLMQIYKNKNYLRQLKGAK